MLLVDCRDQIITSIDPGQLIADAARDPAPIFYKPGSHDRNT